MLENDKRKRKKKKALRFIKVQSGEISGKLKNFLRDIFFPSLKKLRKEKKLKIGELRRRNRVE